MVTGDLFCGGYCFFYFKWKKQFFHNPCNVLLFSLRFFLIAVLLDTDMEKTLLSMLEEIIDFCSVRATIKTEDHSVLPKWAVYKIMSKSARGLIYLFFDF